MSATEQACLTACSGTELEDSKRVALRTLPVCLLIRMMDKLDIRLTTLMPMKAEFHDFLEEVKHHPGEYGFHQSEHYHVVGSLSPFGVDGNFHGWLRHKREDKLQTHKLELNDVGMFGKSRVLADLERVVDVDPRRLEIMRVDLAADVPDVPVSFFHRHMRVALKRRGARVTEFEHIYQGEGETIYFGKRPNCFRVYNKIAELKAQHKKAIRKASLDSEWPTFEQSFSRKESDCLTRIERQITGRMIPHGIALVGKLDVLPDYNPYSSVQMFAGESSLPAKHGGEFNFPQYHTGLWLRQMQQAFGIDYVRTYVRNWVGKQNARAVFEQYEPFFRCVAGSEGVTADQIYETYRDSVKKQLAA